LPKTVSPIGVKSYTEQGEYNSACKGHFATVKLEIRLNIGIK